jgi:hypothetical protein
VEIAEGAYAIGEESWTRLRGAFTPEDEAFARLGSMNLSEDTLILLAFASGKGARTIAAYREWRRRRAGASDEERARDDARWAERYALLAGATFAKDGE